MKRTIALMLTLLLLAGALALPAAATAVSPEDAAQTLSALGLLRGTGNGFELERSATRAEALAMLLRLLGLEDAALAERDACPFDDGGWAAPLETYAWKCGLVQGQSATHFGSDAPVGARDWLTMLLRALGYSDAAGDFSWERSIAFADAVGLTHGEYTAAGSFLRGDMVLVSCNALSMPVSGGGQTLAERLYLSGAVSGAALRTVGLGGDFLTGGADRPVYDAVQTHEKFATATFLVESYMSDEELEKDAASSVGSGFFITADGVAALCYHELEGAVAVRVTTLDGRRYDVTGVLFYDPLWDAAVVRVSRTDTDGNSVGYFPYLERGDSDAVRAGERVFTLSNALGFVDNITEGVISNRSRNVDDPDYPCIQYTAAVSSGSSGGAVLNAHGEVVAIHFAKFINGENMNLGVPINTIAAARLTGAGQPVAAVMEIEAEKKAAAVLTAEQTELSMRYGEEIEVMISHNAPGRAIIRYEIDGWDVVECVWGNFVTKRSVPLTVYAVGDGEANITISFADDNGNEESATVIHVTVTGAPEEPEEVLPSGDTY